MNHFAEVPVLVWLAAAVAALVLLLLAIRLAVGWLRTSRQVQSVSARVVTKRTSTYGHVSSSSASQVYTAYFATFELNSGDRLEFQLPDSAFGLLVEGDQGALAYQGTRWHGFERARRGRSAGRRPRSRAG